MYSKPKHMNIHDEIMCWLLRAIVDHERMVSMITAWGVRWLGLPHSPRTNGNHLIKRRGGCRWVLGLSGRVLAT